jgi:ribose transport system permease protein
MVVAQTNPDTGSETGAAALSGGSGVRLGLRLLSVGPLLILAVLIVVVALITPNFTKPVNLGNILAQTAVIAIVAMGQQLVILTRGIDLSVGANLALATVVGGLVYAQVDSALLVALAMILSGAFVGLVNGGFFVWGRLPHPFLITLATLSICRGLALEIAPGHTTMRGMPDAIEALGATSLAGIPASAFIVLGVALLILVATKAMVWAAGSMRSAGRPRRRSEWAFRSRACWYPPMSSRGSAPGSGRWC